LKVFSSFIKAGSIAASISNRNSMRKVLLVLLVASVSASAQSTQTTLQLYAQHDSAAAAARKAGDWSAYSQQIPILDSILNGHPNVRIVRARIAAHMGDTATGYSNLRDFAAMGLKRRIEADTDLVALRGTPEWNTLIARIAANGAVIGKLDPAFTMPDSDFIAEDITWDGSSKRWLVSGIRHSVIYSVDRTGKQTVFARGPDRGWGFLALAVDSANHTLWATSEAIPLAIGFDTTIAGRAAIFRYDLRTGALLQRYDVPAGEAHGAGDIAVAGNGDLFIADARTGEVRVIRRGKGLELLVPKGELMSPQGPAMAADGQHFYIADYVRGIARVDRTTGRVTWLKHATTIALNGIDGLTLADANTLIGVQNGTNPNRLLRISLSADGTTATATKVIAQDDSSIREPTHGVFAGKDYYFIANGGYGAFGDDGKLRQGERAIAPVIARIRDLR
jgi:sugar lactone lactonase YvrE